MKNKQEIRKEIHLKFQDQQDEKLNGLSDFITAKLYKYINTIRAKNICIYENMKDEVNTQLIISQLREDGYNIYTPQVIGETEMILIDKEFEIYNKEIDIFIIPGRVFSIEGKRLGRGKGYYDRFLSQKIYKQSIKIGICFDFQIFESIPTEGHDILMNKIITND